jgi:predicted Zn finger-like uncharacterized protein
MPDIVTSCPDCNIAFRALPSQLSAAGGLVRCGTCLLVFKAQDHLQQPGEDPNNIEYMPYVLDGFSDLPEDAEYEIEGELSRDLDQHIGDELESLTAEDVPVQSTDQSPSMLFDDELNANNGQKKTKSKLLSLFGSAVILAVGSVFLAAQAVHFNSADLSLDPEYRRLVQKFCAYTDCPITEYRDLSKIEISQFIVQDHPQHYGALSINLLISNKAGYEQRFPSLVIRFNDLNDAPVAQRIFSSDEYLQGRLANAIIMPRNQQIHINLELIDPGDNTTSYAIELTD